MEDKKTKSREKTALGRQAEAEIQRLASFPQLNPFPVLEIDATGAITYSNQAAVAAVEKSRGEARLTDFLPEDLEELQTAARQGGERSYYREVLIADVVFAEQIYYVKSFDVLRVYAGDITPRKRFEEALRAANAQLSALIENSPLAIMRLDEDGTILSCNPAGEQMFGWSVTELVGQKIPMVPPDELEIAKEVLRRVGQGERFIGIERRRLRKDGSLVDLSASVAPMYDESGSVTGIVSIMKDISTRKEAEAALREREAKYRAVIETSTDGFCIADMEGRFLEFNDAFADLLGYSREELLTMGVADIEAQKTPAEIAAVIEKVRAEGHLIFETRLRSQDGRVWPAEPNIVYWPIADGRMFFFVRDITERKQAEDALKRAHDELEQRVRERTADLLRTVQRLQFEMKERLAAEEMLKQSEARFRSAFDQSPVGAVIVDQDLRFQRVNPAFCQITGYTAEELASMNVTDIAHPEDLAKSLEAARSFLAGESDHVRMEQRNIRKDGAVIWIDLGVSVINPGGRPSYFLGIVQDITARKEAEKALMRHAALVRDLYDNAPCGYHSLDQEGRFVQVNNTEAAWLGYTRDELLGGMHFVDLLTPASQKVFRQNFPRFKERGWVQNLEFELIRKDGTMLPVLLNATVVKDEAGHYVMSRATMVDLTERRRAAAALEAGRQRLIAVLEQIPACVALISPDCRILFANREFIRRFGNPGNMPCYEFMFGINAPCEGCQALKILKTNTPELREWNGPDGNTYQVYLHPFTDVNGSPLALKMALEITARKEAERLIQRQSAILAGINRIFRQGLTCETDEELGRTCLTVLEELTGAELGLIYELNPSGRLDATTINDAGLAACNMGTPHLPKNLKIRGFYRSVIQENKSVLINEPASHPDRISIPEGHPQFTAFLGVPLMQGEVVMGLIGLGKKAGGFEPVDQEMAETLSVAIAEALARFRAEERVMSISRLYQVLSKVNEAIVRAQDRETLFGEICRVAVEEGRFKMAWIGLVDRQEGSIKAVAQHGLDTVCLERIRISLRESPESRGPTGIAVRTGKYVVCNDTANDPRMARWREEALSRGYRSAGSFPLRVESEVIGSITMFAGQPGFFTDEEIRLLENLALDVSFAIESLEKEGKRRHTEAALKESEEKLRYLTAQMIHAQESEKMRISLELHDDLGQILTVLKLQVREIDKGLPAGFRELRKYCADLANNLDAVIEKVRLLSRDLSPSILISLGLPAALRHLTEEFSKYHDIKVSMKMGQIKNQFNAEQEINLYRIFQEALNNIVKHAQATRVEITIKKHAGQVTFRVDDNGSGFDRDHLLAKDTLSRGLGLPAIEERVRMLGGKLEISSQAGQGTSITFVVPVGAR